VLNGQVDEYRTVVAVHHPVVAHPRTDLVCGRCPSTVIPSKNEVDPPPLCRPCRRPPSESGKVPRHAELGSFYSGVQELEIGEFVRSGVESVCELFSYLHRRYLPRYDSVGSRIISGWRAVEVPGENNGSVGCGSFESASDQEQRCAVFALIVGEVVQVGVDEC